MNHPVNTVLPYVSVYSITIHEIMGPLVSAHIVKTLPSGKLSLNHQHLLPENFNHFAAYLDQNDHALCLLTSELTIQKIQQKHDTNKYLSPNAFFKSLKDPNKKAVLAIVRQYLQVRITKILKLLAGKNLYLMGKDYYPADTPIKLISEPADIQFAIYKNAQNLHYFPRIRVNQVPIEINQKNTYILLNYPCWVLSEKMLFHIPNVPENINLQPFTRKKFIEIPIDKEHEFLHKFASKLLESDSVKFYGYEVVEIRENPKLCIELSRDNQRLYTIKCCAYYQEYALDINSFKHKIELISQNGVYHFIKVFRDLAAEEILKSWYHKLQTEFNLFNSLFTVLPESDLITWLCKHIAAMRQDGIQIVQCYEKPHFSFENPELHWEIVPVQEDWEFRGEVSLGNKKLTFNQLIPSLMKQSREYEFSDGTSMHIPTSWVTDFRHFVEIAQKTEQGLRFKTYQGLALPQYIQEGHTAIRAMLEEFSHIQTYDPPQELRATLRPYQQAGYDWLRFLNRFQLGGILADDMGLGKTLQTIALICHEVSLNPHFTALVILPNSLLFNWSNELKRFAPHLKVSEYRGSNRAAQLSQCLASHVVLTTYGIARQDESVLQQYVFNYIILDESHVIKNKDSQTTRAILRLNAQMKLSLTGTPLENTTADLWPQLEFLNPGFLGSQSFFYNRYVVPIDKEGNLESSAKLRSMLNPFLLRRTKEQVATELPAKIEQTIYCEMGEDQQAVYDHHKRLFRGQITLDGENASSRSSIWAALIKLRQIALHPSLIIPDYRGSATKYEILLSRIEELISEKGKVLVFSQFVRFLDLLANDLRQKGLSFSYLTGQTQNRQDEVARFQNDSSIKIFLLSLKAGGVGLNLTAANTVFIVDPWWNPATERQAIDRAHRIGQQTTVFAYRLLTQNSVEEKIQKIQERKKNIYDELITAEESFAKSLTKEDLLALFD